MTCFLFKTSLVTCIIYTWSMIQYEHMETYCKKKYIYIFVNCEWPPTHTHNLIYAFEMRWEADLYGNWSQNNKKDYSTFSYYRFHLFFTAWHFRAKGCQHWRDFTTIAHHAQKTKKKDLNKLYNLTCCHWVLCTKRCLLIWCLDIM